MKTLQKIRTVASAILLAVTTLSTSVQAQQYCATNFPAPSTGWKMTSGQNISPAPAQSYYIANSWQELKTVVEETTLAYYAASGWTGFQLTYVGGFSGRWTWSGTTSNGEYRSSDQWGNGMMDAILYYAAGNAFICPSGYALGYNGSFYCQLTNTNLQNCPTTPKPDKSRGACPKDSNAMEGNPCNVATGNKYQYERDYEDAGLFPLQYARHYNSDSGTPSGSLGLQWRGEFDRKLVFSTNTAYSSVNSGTPAAYLYRPDGKVIAFVTYPTVQPRDPDTVEKLTKIDTTTWQLQTSDDSVETYKVNGDHLGSHTYAVLTSIKSRSGVIQTLTYATNGTLTNVTDSFGRSIAFTYDTQSRVSTMTNPAGGVYTYQYNSNGYLSSVAYPNSATKQYQYTDSANPGALTAIIDENNASFASWTYDSSRRAISSQHAGGAERVDFTFNTNGTTSVSDAIGGTRLYTFGLVQNVQKATAVTQSGASQTASFDTNGFLQSRTDRNGVQTVFLHDTRGLETSRTEAYGTARARTITTQWHSTYRLPLQIDEAGRRTTFTYDSNGNLLTKTVTDTATSASRTWTYTYNSFGRILTTNGPRTDVSDITTYAYYSCTTGYQCGQVQTVTNALSQTTTYNTYNAHGQPLTITDPNGVVTTLAYDLRQRLTSRTVGSETTAISYYSTGLVQQVTLPDGSYLNYTYDAAHRLTQITDSDGNHIAYTLDAMGNRTQENVYDPSNALTQTRSRVFNTLSRLIQEIGAAGTAAVTTAFGYDNNGNQTAINAPLARNTTNQYDELNRVTQITDPNSGITQYGYDANDNLTSVTDPRGLVTSYGYNGPGDLTQQTSPDTGVTSMTYDSGGNLYTNTDARNKTATYSYDALNRVTQVAYPDQTISYTYDSGSNGIGRLSSVSDASGSISWTYTNLGRVASKTQTMGSASKNVGYGYNSAGNLTTITTPSGQTVTYSYANGKISSITVNGNTILNDILYEPFGPARQWTWGNSTLAVRTYNQDGNVSQIDSAGLKTYTYDDAFRITGITDTMDSSLSWVYGYDVLDRLNSASKTGLAQSWTYDANGNRLTQGGTASSTFTNSGTSNRLASASGALTRTYSYDNTGNALGDGTHTFTYNDAGRMVSATAGSVTTAYSVNALGQRVRKSNVVSTRYFVYDDSDQLIGEYDGVGNLIQEIAWLGDTPVASIRPNGSGVDIFYIHTDHLDTPRKITRPSDNTIVWRWDSDTFGTTAANENPSGLGNFAFNLRFPGQYFDSETGLHYNYWRDGYDPAVGRYVQSDPIGLDGGINTYAYVNGNPLLYIDPFGLDVKGAAIGGAIGGVVGSIAGGLGGGAACAVTGPGALACGAGGALEGAAWGAAGGAVIGSACENIADGISNWLERRRWEPNKPNRKKQGREPGEKKRSNPGWKPRNPPREPPKHTPSRKT